MPVLPIPMIIAFVLAALLVQRLAARETHGTLLALIAVCALQSAIIALVQYYGFPALRPVRPILAMAIPPIAWLAFRRVSGADETFAGSAWHAIGPVLALFSFAVLPTALDFLIPASFAIYGAAMAWKLHSGEDSLPHSRLESGSSSVRIWRFLAFALVASAVGDVAIARSLAMGQAGLLLWLPSVASALTLFGLGALSLSPAMASRREVDDERHMVSAFDAERDQAIVARLESYMATHKPYLDADLTLSRLARRLMLPAKQVSAAINRVKTENVSRYVNRLRIDEACHLLADGKSVTAAMLESGFNTKSNFNREFQRVKGQSPSQWLAQH